MRTVPDLSKITRLVVEPWAEASPICTGKTKTQYIIEWLTFFDCYLYDETGEPFNDYDIIYIEIAFEWVKAHYRELLLGCNSLWHEAARHVIYSLAKGTWNKATENALKAHYLRLKDEYYSS